MQPLPLVGLRRAICPQCGEVCRPEIVHAVEPSGSLAGERLASLGIPPYDIVRVASRETRKAFSCWPAIGEQVVGSSAVP